MITVHQHQQEITYEFSQLKGDLEKTLSHIIQLSKLLPPLPTKNKTDAFMMRGCHSKVWLCAKFENGLVYFQADSNTAITKGLIQLVIRVVNGQAPQTIVEAELNFIKENRLERFIGIQRSNGFEMMVGQIKKYAHQFLIQA